MNKFFAKFLFIGFLGMSVQAQASPLMSLEMSMPAVVDISSLFDRIQSIIPSPTVPQRMPVGWTSRGIYGMNGYSPSIPFEQPWLANGIHKDTAAFEQASRTHRGLKGGKAGSVLMLIVAGLLVVGLFRQQRVRRFEQVMSF